jgi:hypothetical protein
MSKRINSKVKKQESSDVTPLETNDTLLEVEQPSNEQPSNEQPLNEQPSNEQPSNEQPLNEQPSNEQPSNEQPSNEQPSNEQPSNEQPSNEQVIKKSVSKRGAKPKKESKVSNDTAADNVIPNTIQEDIVPEDTTKESKPKVVRKPKKVQDNKVTDNKEKPVKKPRTKKVADENKDELKGGSVVPKPKKKSKKALSKEKLEDKVIDGSTPKEEDEIDKKVRSFKVRLPDKQTFEGRFTGLTPYQAANKALSKYFRETPNPEPEIVFSICESTRKSKKTIYTYIGKRIKLEIPVTYKIQDGRQIVKNFKNSLKKIKKDALPPIC